MQAASDGKQPPYMADVLLLVYRCMLYRYIQACVIDFLIIIKILNNIHGCSAAEFYVGTHATEQQQNCNH